MRKRILWGALLTLVVSACESPNVLQPDGAPDLTQGLVAKNGETVLLGSGFSFTEGPATDHWGNVYFSDQPNDKIHRWDWQTGAITQFLTPTGRSNGMAFDRDGNLITAADMHGEIWSIDPAGNVTVLVDNYNGKLLNGPNDLWIAPNGGIYFTDPLFVRSYWDATDPRRSGSQQGGGFVYYLSPDRQTLTRVSGADVLAEFPPPAAVWPNGIVGTPDGEHLYVGYFSPQRIYRYDINPDDGSLSNRILFASRGTDGMTIDNQGNIYTTSRVRAVVVFSPEGVRLPDIPTGGTATTSNVAFGGPNRKTLFITAGPAVFGVDMHVRGAE